MTRHRPPGVFRRTASAVAAGALALAGAVALPAASAHADTTANGESSPTSGIGILRL